MKKQDILENQAKKVYLGIGSNWGNRIKNIDKAKYLIRSFNIKILKSSSYYKTESWPNKSFPYYINVGNVEEVPEVIADALRQWFQLINSWGWRRGERKDICVWIIPSYINKL